MVCGAGARAVDLGPKCRVTFLTREKLTQSLVRQDRFQSMSNLMNVGQRQSEPIAVPQIVLTTLRTSC